MKTAEDYRARVIQLEAFIARLALAHRLSGDDRDIYEYVRATSIAATERDVPQHMVTPLEDLVGSGERCKFCGVAREAFDRTNAACSQLTYPHTFRRAVPRHAQER